MIFAILLLSSLYFPEYNDAIVMWPVFLQCCHYSKYDDEDDDNDDNDDDDDDDDNDDEDDDDDDDEFEGDSAEWGNENANQSFVE